MKCSLDTTKASKLRGVINKNDYCYMYDYDRYFELCTIMDRMEDTVELINNFELPEKEDQFNATDFISWLNYAHLIYNCLFSLNKIFVVPNNKTLFACGKTKFYNDIEKHKTKYLGKYYSGVADGSDDDFFRYLRSMVLAHALKIDHEEFEKFSGSKYTYTPLVRWNSAKDSVDISYYVPDYKDKHRHLSIDISDLFEYLKTPSRSQLLVTTHNDGLLDLVDDLIRKDSVWFTEKKKSGVTDLYKLTDFRGVNRLSSIREAYRNKRFGATMN